MHCVADTAVAFEFDRSSRDVPLQQRAARDVRRHLAIETPVYERQSPRIALRALPDKLPRARGADRPLPDHRLPPARLL